MQNDHLHPIFRNALAPFAPRTNVVSRVSHPRPVVVLEEQSANEGDFTAEDLAAIDAQYEPRKFIRTPELDKRVMRDGKLTGEAFNANAWFEVSSGRYRFASMGYDLNARRWLPLNDVQGRAAIDAAHLQGETL